MVDVTIDGQEVATSFKPTTTSGIIGTTTNDNAAAGSVGEFITSIIPFSSPAAIVSLATTTITSLSLTAGDWQVWGSIGFIPAATTNVRFAQVATNTIAGQIGPQETSYRLIMQSSGFVYGAGAYLSGAIPEEIYSVASTTTVFLTARIRYAISTLTAFGFISAVRIR